MIASTDYIRTFADQIRQWVPGRYRVLGTDGYGRSDFRSALRRFFEVDRHYVTVAALKELADEGTIDAGARAGGDRALRDRHRRPDADDRMSTAEAVSVEVPDIGDFDDVPIIEILVSPGDTVGVDDPLLTLESDKATMDVPAPFAGTVGELQVKIGDKVSQGTRLLTLTPRRRARRAPQAAAAADQGAPSEAQAPDAVGSATEAEAQAAPQQPRRATPAAPATPAASAEDERRRADLRQPGGAAPRPRARRRPLRR